MLAVHAGLLESGELDTARALAEVVKGDPLDLVGRAQCLLYPQHQLPAMNQMAAAHLRDRRR